MFPTSERRAVVFPVHFPGREHGELVVLLEQGSRGRFLGYPERPQTGTHGSGAAAQSHVANTEMKGWTAATRSHALSFAPLGYLLFIIDERNSFRSRVSHSTIQSFDHGPIRIAARVRPSAFEACQGLVAGQLNL